MKINQILKYIITGLFMVAFLLLVSTCSNLYGELDNPVDPESDLFTGTLSIDRDGDGIGQYFDIDEIEIIYPESGYTILTEDLTLEVNNFDPSVLSNYWIQIASDISDFEGSLIIDDNNHMSSQFSISLEPNFINNTVYYWRAKAFDGDKWSKNWSHVSSFSFGLGSVQSPVLSGISPTNNTRPTWTWNEPQGAVEYHYSFTDGQGWISTSDNFFTPAAPLSDEIYILYLQAKDSDGYWSSSSFFEIIVDTTAPSAPTASSVTPTSDTSPAWSWTGSADAVKYRYSFTDGSGWIETTENNFTSAVDLSDGFYTIYIQTGDAAGNWSISSANVIEVNTAIPSPPTVSGLNLTTDKTPTWTWDTPSGSVEFRYSFTNGSGWTNISATNYTPDSDLMDGNYTLYVQAENEVGNWSASGSHTVLIDSTLTGTPVVSGLGLTNDNTPTWTWSIPAGAVEYRYSYIDGSVWTTTSSNNYTETNNLSDGYHTLYVQAKNAVGNWSESGSLTIEIDTVGPTAPTISAVSPTNVVKPTWSWNSPADAVEYQYSFTDGSGWITTTGNNYTPGSGLSEGLHTLYVQARDALGNWSSSAYMIIEVDISAPLSPTFTGASPNNDTTPTWSWNSPVDAVEYRYSFTDGSGWNTTTGNSHTSSTVLAEGSHTLYVQAKDSAGNWSSSRAMTIVIDTSAPTAPAVSGTTPTNDPTPPWSWNSPVDAVQYRYSFTNGSGWISTAGNTFTPAASLSDGFYTLYVQAGDFAGNWSSSGTRSIELDTTAPAIPVVIGTTFTYDATPTWSWDNPVDAVLYRYSFTNGFGWTITSESTYTPAVDLLGGNYTLYVQAADTVENWSASSSLEIEVFNVGSQHGGGIVFYLDGSGTGLIAAEFDQGSPLNPWYIDIKPAVEGLGTNISSGQVNTSAIVNAQGAGVYAAKLCDDLELNGFNDWFLPSKDELNLIYTNLYSNGIGGLFAYYYWSSSSYDYWSPSDGLLTNYPWRQYFNGGTQSWTNASNLNRVRAIRYFNY